MKAKGRSTGAIEEQMNSALANKARYDAAAADAIYQKVNQDMLAYEYDLHGLYAAEAAARTHKVLNEAVLSGDPVAIFIIGHRSHHGSGASVETKVENVIQKLGFEYYISDARFTVHLPKKAVPCEASPNKLGTRSSPQVLDPSPTHNVPPAGSSGLKTASAARSASVSKAREPRTSQPSNSYKTQTPRSRKV
ncbi:hypothetical protein CPB85DRAFT_1282835 [Mucidula mucida]|nr:hypothetical protein CPB85DRAFT_1282835 [Mucidula mucida]